MMPLFPSFRSRRLLAAGIALLCGTAGLAASDRPSTTSIREFATLGTVTALTAPQRRSWSAQIGDHGARAAGAWQMTTIESDAAPTGSATPGSYAPDSHPPTSLSAEDRLEIRLQQGAFDPLREPAPLYPALATASRADNDNHDYFLMQMHGPLPASLRDQLDALDVEVIDYVPDFAYLVRATPAAIEAARATAPIRWTDRFAPGFRLSNELLESALAARSGEHLDLLLRTFPGESLDALPALRAGDSTVVEIGEDSGGGTIVRLHTDATQLLALAHERGIAWIEPMPQLAFSNAVARSNTILGKDQIEQQLGYFGEGQIVAVTDSGLSTGNANTVHADFQGRVIGASWGPGSCGHWADGNYHGTHVAGSVLGSGVRSGSNPAGGVYAGSQAGIAPRAQLVVWSTCDDFSGVPMSNPYTQLWTQLYGFNAALRANNNSWGATGAGVHGTYNLFTRETDRFMRDFPDMVAVFAAGNDGTDQNGDGVSDMTTVLPPSTGKNVISVGASENVRSSGGFNPGGACATYGQCWSNKYPANPLAGDPVSNNAQGMAAFSGRGPTRSSRLKPDIVAPGTNVVSAYSELASSQGWGIGNQYYVFAGGTSMASPLVTGGVAILREYFQRQFSHNPSASLVKAVLINSARDLTPGQYGTGAWQDVWSRPDVNQGWGRMDLPRALLATPVRSATYFEVYPGLQSNQQAQTTIAVRAPGSELRITMAWADAAGMEASHGALVNDLDLEVVDPNGTVHYGFAGYSGPQRDRFNNVEEVRLATAPAGTYTVRVRGFNVPTGPQPYSMVVSGNLSQDVIFQNGFQP